MECSNVSPSHSHGLTVPLPQPFHGSRLVLPEIDLDHVKMREDIPPSRQSHTRKRTASISMNNLSSKSFTPFTWTSFSKYNEEQLVS